MVLIQLLLLHVALLHRPPIGAAHSLSKPFADSNGAPPPIPGSGGPSENFMTRPRPYNFWQWRPRKPYFHFLLGYTLTLLALQVLLGASSPAYVSFQGYLALSIEALLPLPQILENQRTRSCAGFRVSVLANWLVGDAFKMTYFFLSGGSVPWAFKACGIFQACCDSYLGVQWWMFGNGPEGIIGGEKREGRMA